MKSTVGAASLWAESAGKSRHEAPNREIVRLRVPTPRSLLVQATDHVPASNDKSYLPPHRNTDHLPALPNMNRPPPLANTMADSFSPPIGSQTAV